LLKGRKSESVSVHGEREPDCAVLCVRILLPFYIHISSRSPRISHCASTRNEIRPLKSAPSAAKHSVSPTINNLLLLLIPFLPLNFFFFFFLPSSTKIEHFQQQKLNKGKERERKKETIYPCNQINDHMGLYLFL